MHKNGQPASEVLNGDSTAQSASHCEFRAEGTVWVAGKSGIPGEDSNLFLNKAPPPDSHLLSLILLDWEAVDHPVTTLNPLTCGRLDVPGLAQDLIGPAAVKEQTQHH